MCCIGLLLDKFVTHLCGPAHLPRSGVLVPSRHELWTAQEDRKPTANRRTEKYSNSKTPAKQVKTGKAKRAHTHLFFFRTMWQGRLYVKNLPVTMQWWEVQNFVEAIGLPRPTWVHLNKKCGLDVRSAFLHFNVSQDFLEWIMEMLNSGHWLSHKQLVASLAEDPPPKKACVPWPMEDTMSCQHGSCMSNFFCILLVQTRIQIIMKILCKHTRNSQNKTHLTQTQRFQLILG